MSYSEIHIYKPTISRLSNSEKYIVCKGFKPFNKEIIDLMNRYFDNCNNLHIDVPKEFIDKNSIERSMKEFQITIER